MLRPYSKPPRGGLRRWTGDGRLWRPINTMDPDCVVGVRGRGRPGTRSGGGTDLRTFLFCRSIMSPLSPVHAAVDRTLHFYSGIWSDCCSTFIPLSSSTVHSIDEARPDIELLQYHEELGTTPVQHYFRETSMVDVQSRAINVCIGLTFCFSSSEGNTSSALRSNPQSKAKS